MFLVVLERFPITATARPEIWTRSELTGNCASGTSPAPNSRNCPDSDTVSRAKASLRGSSPNGLDWIQLLSSYRMKTKRSVHSWTAGWTLSSGAGANPLRF